MRRKRINPLRGVGIIAVLAMIVGTGWGRAGAEYQDLIDTPVLKIPSASQSLLIDVTRIGQRLLAVGERGHIVFSDDQGANWTQARVATRAHLNSVTFVDQKKGWAVGEDGVILNTRDGGTSWQRQFDARDADTRGPLLDVYFLNADEGLAVGVFNKVYRTGDGGKTWVDGSANVDNLDEWHLFAIAAASRERIYIASEQGLLFRSEDGGQSFAPLQTDHDGSFHGILARTGPDGQDQIVLSGVGGVLYVSRDSGATWSRLETHTQDGLSGSAWLDDGSAMIVGYGGIVLKLNADLTETATYPQENGLPLSAVTPIDAKQVALVGFGGVQTIPIP